MKNKSENINVWSYLEEYEDYDNEILEIVSKVFKSGKLILGNNVKEFEENFSKWLGSKYGTGVGNGTDAIKLALLALEIGKDDEVITVSNTAVPTISAIVETGAKPVFCDVTEKDYNISAEAIEELITKKTKAIMVPNLIGNIPNWKKIKQIAIRYNLKIIEDSADTLGATINAKPTGIYSDISITSFYGSHVISCAGNGGMFLTNDKNLFKKAKVLTPGCLQRDQRNCNLV